MFDYFLKGGIMMYPLLLASVFAVAIVINKIYAYRRAKIDAGHLMTRIKEFLERGMPEGAIAFCDKTGGPIAGILKAGLSHYGEGKDVMEEAFETASLEEIPRLEKFLPTLSTIASISTLMGFTGTVTGMISAFNAIARANTSSPSIVATGVAEALITTATGLFIAIPTVVFYYYFTHTVDRFILDIEKSCKEMVRLVYSVKTPDREENKK